MKEKLVKESLDDILKPKSNEEIENANNVKTNIIGNIFYSFVHIGRGDIIEDFDMLLPGDGIGVTFEFKDTIDYETTKKALNMSNYKYEDLEVFDNVVNFIIPMSELNKHIDESIGGAGYAVWGGGGSRSFGNPSYGGRFYGRGFGFGSSNNTGGPNLMYTYDVKPLNKTLEQPGTTQDDEQYIYVGSIIKGKEFRSEKELEGHIVSIKEDNDNNIQAYVIVDSKTGKKVNLDPTSVYLVKYNEMINNQGIEEVDEGYVPLYNVEVGKTYNVYDETVGIQNVKVLSIIPDGDGRGMSTINVELLDTGEIDKWYLEDDEELFMLQENNKNQFYPLL